MDNFWTNIIRYPRFFVSSLLGLILTILTPIRNLLKIKKLRIVFLIVGIGILLSLYFVLAAMTAI